MGTLNQPLQASVGYEQPVQRPSIMGGIADLAGLFELKKPSAGEVKHQRDVTLYDNLIRDMKTADALRKQGKPGEANKLERIATVNYLKSGGTKDATYTSIVEAYTGVSEESFGFEPGLSPEDMETPEFKTAYLAEKDALGPDATETELINAAFVRLQESAVVDQRIENSKNRWSTEGKDAYLKKITDWRQSNRGALRFFNDKGQRVDNRSVQMAMASFNELEATLLASRPEGISDAEWKPVQDYIDVTKTFLNKVNEMTGIDDIRADFIIEIDQGLRVLLEREDITEVEKNVALSYLTSPDGVALINSNAVPVTRVMSILEAAAGVNELDLDDTVGAGLGNTPASVNLGSESFSEKELEVAKTTDAEGSFAKADGLFELTRVTNFKDSPKMTERWVSFTSNGLANLYTMASRHGGWLDDTGYRKFFDTKFIFAMQELHGFDSRLYESMYNKTSEALDANITAVRASLVSRTEGDIVYYDIASNKLVFNEEVFMSNPNISGVEKTEFKRLVDAKYGGDFIKGVMDKGIGIRPVMEARIQLEDAQVLDRIKALDYLYKTKESLPAPTPVEGSEGSDTVGGTGGDTTQGSAGEDTLGEGNGPIAQSLGIDFAGYEEANGLPSGYLERVAYIESKGNPSAKNPNSSAGGLFQQIDSNAKAYGVVDRFDAIQSTEGAVKFAVDNVKILEKALGRKPQGWELYLAHQQGGAGAAKLLSNPSAKAVDIVGKDAVRLNGGHENMTAGEFAKIWATKYSGGRGPVNYSQATGKPNENVRPNLRPESLGDFSEAAQTVDTMSTQQAVTTPQRTAEAAQVSDVREGTQEKLKGAKKTADEVTDILSLKTKEVLDNLGVDPKDVPVYENGEEVSKAFRDGKLTTGDVIIIGGQLIQL